MADSAYPEAVKTLSIDVASHEGHIACVEGADVRALRRVERVGDAEFVPLAESVLKDAGWHVRDIGRVACNVGPGGFTSVRNGVTFANALADQLEVPLAGYHGSDLAFARATAAYWTHSTRSDQLFVRGGAWTEPTLVTLDEALAAITNGPAITGDLLDAHREALVARGAVIAPVRPLEDALPAFLEKLPAEKRTLVPWYGRGI